MGDKGWSAIIKTDLDSGEITDFKGKENKWFGYIAGEFGDDISISDISHDSSNVHGIGIPVSNGVLGYNRTKVKVTIKN